MEIMFFVLNYFIMCLVFGDGGLLIVGYIFYFIVDFIKFGCKCYEWYGEISWVNVFGIWMISMFGLDVN